MDNILNISFYFLALQICKTEVTPKHDIFKLTPANIRAVGRSENLGCEQWCGVITCPPGWDRVNWCAKNWGCHAMAPQAPIGMTGLNIPNYIKDSRDSFELFFKSFIFSSKEHFPFKRWFKSSWLSHRSYPYSKRAVFFLTYSFDVRDRR